MGKDKVNQFLLKHKLSPDSVDLDKIVDLFIKEMKFGLENKNSMLPMIPTYTEEGKDIKSGESVIVLDAGGTNFRTCLVSFDENKQAVISDFKKVGMPGVKEEVSAKEFFSILADNVERLIDKSDKIGFCFSYAAEITEDHDGIPLMFSKEVKAPEVIGMKIGESLLKELASRGYDVSKKKVAIVNDTVATLLAGKAASEGQASGYVGFILGTGTNTAYLEKNENIKKINYKKEGSQIINVESGNLNTLFGDIDKGFLATTKNPDQYLFEKMISGAYIGPFSHYVLEEAIKEGLFSDEFASRFSKIDHLTTTKMSHYLEMCHNVDYDLVQCVGDNEDDAIALWIILEAIIERAAKLTAANLSSAILMADIGQSPRYPAIVNADGTTFYKTEFLEGYTKYYLHEFLEKKHRRYAKLVRIDDSPVLGAAIAGLSL